MLECSYFPDLANLLVAPCKPAFAFASLANSTCPSPAAISSAVTVLSRNVVLTKDTRYAQQPRVAISSTTSRAAVHPGTTDAVDQALVHALEQAVQEEMIDKSHQSQLVVSLKQPYSELTNSTTHLALPVCNDH